MSNSHGGMPPAGWHADPAGSGRKRWWNGVEWSDTYGDEVPENPVAYVPPVHEPAAYVPAQAPIAQDPGAYAPTAYSPAAYSPVSSQFRSTGQPYSMEAHPRSDSFEVAPNTPFIWVFAVLPLLSVVWAIASNFIPEPAAQGGPSTATLINGLLSICIIITNLVLAYHDARMLRARGMHRPFGWGWAFFASGLVYLIGRTVVVRRRTGGGLAPLFVGIGAYLLGFILQVAIAFVPAFLLGFSSGFNGG